MLVDTRRELPAIHVEGVSKRYGAHLAVDGVDLDVRRGEMFGLIGHNGAGKSTLFKLMLGLVAPTAGRLEIAGSPVSGPDFRAVRRRIGYLPENVVLWDNLSGRETLRFFARLKGLPHGDLERDCDAMLERVGLADAAARHVREYSKGMRQRLGFAQALLGSPQVLFLDEPTTGLDPHAIRAFHETLAELRAQGVTMLLSSHILAELQNRVDRLAVLANGRVHAIGSVQALREARGLPLSVTLVLREDGLAQAVAAIEWMHATRPGAAAADGLLRPELAGDDVAGGSVVRLRCPRDAKVALLQALAPLGPKLLDVQCDEPSLEDLFFAAPPANARAAAAARAAGAATIHVEGGR